MTLKPVPVAHTQREEDSKVGRDTDESSTGSITLIDESNPLSYQIYGNQIILSLIEVFGYVAPQRASRIFEGMLKNGFFNVQTLSALYVINNEKVITFHDLIDQLKMPASTTHRVLKQLVSQGVINKISKVRNKNGLPGPRLTLYGLPDAGDKELEDCLRRERTRTTEGFKLYEELQQLLITEYLEPNKTEEIHYYVLCKHLRTSWDNPGYNWGDVIKNVESGLKQKGYKVMY